MNLRGLKRFSSSLRMILTTTERTWNQSENGRMVGGPSYHMHYWVTGLSEAGSTLSDKTRRVLPASTQGRTNGLATLVPTSQLRMHFHAIYSSYYWPDLADIYRHLFPFNVFNAVQSACFMHLTQSDSNLVVSAPTGSGKTALFELGVVKMLIKGNGRAVYIAPTKVHMHEY